MSALVEKVYRVEYDSNNSGGGWWLSDEDWQSLEKEGWNVQWLGLSFCHSRFGSFVKHSPPNTCATSDACPGHRGAESYAEAVKAGKDARWLGSLARSATIEIKAYSPELAEGVAEAFWSEALPNQDASDEGCDCCGRPHNFYAREVRA